MNRDQKLAAANTQLALVLCFLLMAPDASPAADPKIESLLNTFRRIVSELEDRAQKEKLSLASNENIKDVVTFLYVNTVWRLKLPFGTWEGVKDQIWEGIKQESWTWCWLPIVPPEVKQRHLVQLRTARQILISQMYNRVVVYAAMAPGLVATAPAIPDAARPDALLKVGDRLRTLDSRGIVKLITDKDLTYSQIIDLDAVFKFRIP